MTELASRQIEVTLSGNAWAVLTHLLLTAWQGNNPEGTVSRSEARGTLLVLLDAAAQGATPAGDARITDLRAQVDSWLADHGGPATDAERRLVSLLVRRSPRVMNPPHDPQQRGRK